MLDDVSLRIPAGKTVAIVGESGCGKTVMLKLIIGLLQPSRGSVWFDGENLAKMGGKELVKLRLRFGFLSKTARWTNRPTFQQVISFDRHRPR